jgi:PiT family inorganic phosphate transporter
MTAITITLASKFHLPVSTTHILSSSVAWSMYVWEKAWGVRWDTVKNILMAWVLTLPATILMSWVIFMVLWFIFVR